LSQSAIQSVHIDIPVPEPHIGSGKNSQTTFQRKEREETFRRATEEDPSPAVAAPEKILRGGNFWDND